MRRQFLGCIFSLLLASFATRAQEIVYDVLKDSPKAPFSWNNMPFLNDVRKVNFEMDFHKAIINDLDFEDFKAMEPNWNLGVKDITMRFMSSFNKSSATGPNPIRISLVADSPITFHLSILTVSEGGSHVEGCFEVRDSLNRLLFSKKVYSEKGRFGTQLNLMGDALEQLGEELGAKLSFNPSFCEPEISINDVQNSIRELVQKNESLALWISVSERCRKQLMTYSQDIIDSVAISTMESSCRDNFFKSLSKCLRVTIPENQIFIDKQNLDGATMHINLASLYNGVYTSHRNLSSVFLIAEIYLINPDGTIVTGIIENGCMQPKNFLTTQMQDIGKLLGKIK